MTNYRALCARMADELDHYRQLLMDDRREVHALATEARTALAEPEHRMGPTDDELLSLDQLRDAWNAQADAMNSWDELGIDEIIWWAQRQALARWGRAAPVPVSERLPGPDDCLDEGWAWFFNPRTGWRQATQPVHSTYTHWLPFHALPLPTTEA